MYKNLTSVLSLLTISLKMIKLFCFIVFIGEAISETQFRCDYEFNKNANGWLKFHTVPANWFEARLRCRFEGATLASPTPELKSALYSILLSNPSACQGIYTGFSDTYSNGDYATVDGIPLSKIPHVWSPCEPNNLNGREHCLKMNKDSFLEDVHCNDTLPFVCFKKYENLVLNSCGTIDNGYVLEGRTGSCYKFHRNPHSWNRAHMICEAEGGYLAIINSDNEAKALADIFSRFPANLIISSLKDYALIGFRDWDEHVEWRTIQGQTLQETGYNKFEVGHPDNARGRQYCGCIHRSGILDDIECDEPFSFICEKNPGLSCQN